MIYFAQYNITQQEFNQLKNGEAVNTSEKTMVFKITDNSLANNIFNKTIMVDEGSGSCIISQSFVAGELCGCDHHVYGAFCTCPIQATPDQWITTWGTCPTESGGGGGGGNGSTGDPNDPTEPGSGCKGCGGDINTTPVFEETFEPGTPCDELKELFNTDSGKPSVKPYIENSLRPNILINPDGEKGIRIMKDTTGVTAIGNISATTETEILIPSGGNYYSAIHTHPKSAYPMFSWSDVYNLYLLNQNKATHNADVMASFLLVCQDDFGVFQTYAIVFNQETIDTLSLMFNSPLNVGSTPQQVVANMDKKIKAKYDKEYNDGTKNYEKAFLQQFANSNISLYKANATLDDWSRLHINQITNNTQEEPCN